MRRLLLFTSLFLAAAVLALVAMRFALPRGQARPQPAPVAGVSPEPSPAAAAPAMTGDRGPARQVTLEVGGMVCAACSVKVSRQLAALPGMRRVDLDLKRATVQLECDAALADTALTAAVRRAGPEYLGLVVASK